MPTTTQVAWVNLLRVIWLGVLLLPGWNAGCWSLRSSAMIGWMFTWQEVQHECRTSKPHAGTNNRRMAG